MIVKTVAIEEGQRRPVSNLISIITWNDGVSQV